MKDLKPMCNVGGMPGIKKLYYCSVDEVAAVTVTAEDTVSVSLKSGCQWGEIHGKDTHAESSFDRNFVNRIETTLPGWRNTQAVGIARLVSGRYLVKFTDRSGQNWICGYGEPMRLTMSESSPASHTERHGITIVFNCESEFGFLKVL